MNGVWDMERRETRSTFFPLKKYKSCEILFFSSLNVMSTGQYLCGCPSPIVKDKSPDLNDWSKPLVSINERQFVTSHFSRFSRMFMI